MKAKKKKTSKKPAEKPSDSCLLIQWTKATLNKNGDPVCPRCGDPAELIIGVIGNPCYAHK